MHDFRNIQHYFMQRRSNGWRLIIIDKYGEVSVSRNKHLDEYRSGLNLWASQINDLDTRSFSRPVWSLNDRFREDVIINAMIVGGFALLCAVVAVTALFGEQAPLLAMLITLPPVVLSVLLQIRHAFFDRTTYRISFDAEHIVLSLASGKLLRYSMADIGKARLNTDEIRPSIRFRDGYQVNNLHEFSYAPLLLGEIKRRTIH